MNLKRDLVFQKIIEYLLSCFRRMVCSHWTQVVPVGGRLMAGVASRSGEVKQMVLAGGGRPKWMAVSLSGTTLSSPNPRLQHYSPPSPYHLPFY